ncbi:hypothetical protein D3C87_1765280 [compost metagenome]
MKFHWQLRHGRKLLHHGLQPDKMLSVRDRIFSELLIQERQASGLAGKFAGGKGDETRQHPWLHARNGTQRNAALLKTLFKACDIFG